MDREDVFDSKLFVGVNWEIEPNSSPDGSVQFSFAGRNYRIARRDGPESSFYIRLQHDGKIHKQSLGSDERVAIHRAMAFIAEHRPHDCNGELPTVQALSHSATFAPLMSAPEDAPPPPNGSLADLIQVYMAVHTVGQRTARNNVLALRKIIEVVTGVAAAPSSIALTMIDGPLVGRYQSEMVKRYCHAAEKDSISQRLARERSLRTSRSVIAQARSVFGSADADLPGAYRAVGVLLPACIRDFMDAKVRGKMVKPDYNPVSDGVIRETFAAIEMIRERDPDLFTMFWLAVGAGLRRSEILRARWEHIVEQDGALWVDGGIGKDGLRIRVKLQQKAVEALANLRQKSGPIVNPGSRLPDRFCAFLKNHGWTTQKKIGELRALTGSKMYAQKPLAAMMFLRHKSITTTERFYVRYSQKFQSVEVL